MTFVAVIELCCNNLNGSIPTQIRNLKKLNVLALQHNQLTSPIPRTLGGLPMLHSLDLSFNQLIGSIPAAVYVFFFFFLQFDVLMFVGLQRLNSGFSYKNNRDLCGASFSSLRPCTGLDMTMINDLEPFTPLRNTTLPQNIIRSANITPHCHQLHTAIAHQISDGLAL